MMNYSGSKWLVRMNAIIMIVLTNCSYFAEPLELTSEHFKFNATTYTSTIEEMQEGINHAEQLYNTLSSIIPSDYPLDSIIVVQLNGNYRSQGPYVDGNGTIQLWRYSEEEGGYWALFPHELVHAIGFDTAVKLGMLEWASLGFYNEAWAEYMAQLIAPEKTGFPFYGFDEDIVVGHWVSQGGPTLASLRSSHNELNLACSLQSYTMRASWFRYVDETYGRQLALEIMYGGREMKPATVEEILGEDLDVVDKGWREWVLKRYNEHPETESQTSNYLDKVGWYVPCQ